MYYASRLADSKSAERYPLPVDGGASWEEVEAGIWRTEMVLPDLPSAHIIVPSFAQCAEAPYAFQFVLNTADGSFALNPVPSAEREQAGNDKPTNGREKANGPVSCHIDCWHTHAAVDAPTLSLQVHTPQEPYAYLLTANVRPLEIAAPPPPATAQDVRVRVPAVISQMQADDAIKHRICSPTALAMALSAFDDAPDWPATVAACYDPATRAYGAWPLAIRWASHHGILGAVETIWDWQSALAVLAGGTPLVCSIRFAKGKLTNAPLQQTGGHLVLLYGIEGDHVLARDPAAATHDEVDRRYPLDEFSAAWLRWRGAAYVFCAR